MAARTAKTELKETSSINADKKKKIEAALATIEKSYGKGSVMRMGDRPILEVEVVSTGSIELDAALGIGGLAKGRIVEIYGPESVGKTLISLRTIAESQRNGGACALIDAEHAFSPEWAKTNGVDVENLYVSQPDNGEQALGIAEELICSGAFDVIVIDSVSALVPKAEIEGEMGDSHMALQARLMSQALRKLTGAVSKHKVLLIFINQLRMKIGVFFGNPETTTGGNALKFYSSVRIDIRKQDVTEAGHNMKVKIVKNKLAPPFKQCLVPVSNKYGVDSIAEIFEIAVKKEIIEKAGSWFSYGDNRLGQGADNVKEILRGDKSLFEEIKSKVVAEHEAEDLPPNEIEQIKSQEE